MAVTQIRGGQIKDLEIVTSKLAESAVTTAKIADSNVTTVKIADSNVTTVKLADLAVTEGKLADNAVTAAKLADDAVDAAAIADGAITGGAQLAASVDVEGKTLAGGAVGATVSGTLSVSGTASFTNPVSVATPVASGDAATKGYVDTAIDTIENAITALGNAFNYIGVVEGGADVASAFDMATLAAGGKDVGDYYKVSVAGYFKVGAGAEFYANVGDGLVWNTASGVDKIDNTDSNVAGTTDFIEVTGSADTGFVVDIDDAFKGRMTNAETKIGAATWTGDISDQTTLTGAAQDLQGQIGSLSNLDALIAANGNVVAAINEVQSDVGNVANLTTTATNVVAAINEVNAKSAGTSYVRETPTGTVDGANTSFALAQTPVAGTVQVYLNGVLQEPTDDYTISGANVTFVSAPFAGDKVRAIYFK